MQTFSSVEDAGASLAAVVKSGVPDRIPEMLGPGSKEIVLSGDSVADKNAGEAFVQRYAVMHRWRRMPDDSMLLLIGADNFPFAIPLRRNDSGRWYWDLAAGKEEMLSRRVGRNELDTIDSCLAIVNAQQDYSAQAHDGNANRQYAVKFISDDGKQNGLYWRPRSGEPESPLGPLAAFASGEGYEAKANARIPFHGYYFKMLTSQGSHAPGGTKDYLVNGKLTGGFAAVAYPAVYGNSGIMTFLVNQDGVVLEKDLGKDTVATASAMSSFDPDSTWKPVELP